MAVSVGRTIDELKKLTEKVGIADQIVATGKNGRIMKEDLINPLRIHFLKERYGDLSKVPSHMELILSLKSPMLAARIDGFKEEQQDIVWDSPDWGFEEKLNGVRCLIISDGNGIHLYSRHNSDVDMLPIEFTDHILLPDNCDLGKLSKKFIVDCEMVSDMKNLCTIMDGYGVTTEGELQAVVALLSSDTARAVEIQRKTGLRLKMCSFDCLYYEGQWIMNEPLKKRKEVAREIITDMANAGMKVEFVPFITENKREYYKNIVKSGGEGVVAKDINSIYLPDSARGFKHGWAKIKRNAMSLIVDEENVGDTVDAFITGAVPGDKGSAFEGLIGAFIASVYLKDKDGNLREHEIARISGIDMKMRKAMTVIVGGEPSLNPSFYGQVVEIDGQGLSSRSMRLNHAVFLQMRYGKNKDSCILEESLLEKMRW